MRLARRLFRLALAFAALICLASTAHAQSSEGPFDPLRALGAGPLADYTLTTCNENDGLPAGRIRAIAQDADGYLWLGTDAGLVRFDGVRFDAWRSLGDARLPVGAVTALLNTRDGALWVGVS